MKKKQSARLEDYLETIYELRKEEGEARVSNIAKMLDVKMPTVNSAINSLKDKGLVNHSNYGDVTLTKAGEEIAIVISKRHEVLTNFLQRILGVDAQNANVDACRMEHALSEETARRLSKFVEFVMEAPAKPEWLEGFEGYLESGKRPEKCFDRCGLKME